MTVKLIYAESEDELIKKVNDFIQKADVINVRWTEPTVRMLQTTYYVYVEYTKILSHD